MKNHQTSGDVILQLSQHGLRFCVAEDRPIYLQSDKRTEKLPSRHLGTLLLAISLWSLPLLTQAANVQSESLIIKTNHIRQSHGLEVLTSDPALNEAAAIKAHDMFEQQFFAHTSPGGTTPWNYFYQSGYRFTTAGENLALEPSPADDPMAAWMASMDHRKNILNPQFTDIGIAIVSGTFQNQPTTFIVQLFGSQRSITSIPTKNPALFINQTSPKFTSLSTVSSPPTSNDERLPKITMTTPPSSILNENERTLQPTVLGVRDIVIPNPINQPSFISGSLESISPLILYVISIYLMFILFLMWRTSSNQLFMKTGLPLFLTPSIV